MSSRQVLYLLVYCNDMKEQIAIIAGGTGFIGKVIAGALKRSGWKVVTLSRRGGGESDLKCDITDENAAREVIRSIADTYGTIDACIHSAAVKIDSKDTSGMQTSVALLGAKNLAAAALPHMAEGSAFIAITTKLIEPGIKTMPTGDYLSAKSALRGYLRELARSAGNIRVYAVAPGFIAGGLNEGIPVAFLEMFAKKTGAGMTTAEAVADIVKKICIDVAAYKPSSSIAIPGEVTAL